MTAERYLGLDVTDIPCCYRHRAQTLADAGMRPVTAVVVEFSETGQPFVVMFGATEALSQRECAALVLQAVEVLAATAAGFNAAASN